MSPCIAISLLVLLFPPDEAPVAYEISFDNAAHHEANITITYRDLPTGVLELRMSRTSPGRYALHDFARHVYEVSARSGAGEALEVTHPNPHQWNVSGHDGTVIVRYTLFGDRADGTYTGIDESHAHLNMPATFLWARGTEERPVRIDFAPRAGWKIATQLEPTATAHRFLATDLQYFIDSPTELSDFSLGEWQVLSRDGREATLRLALHHDGSEAEFLAYLELTKAVVREQQAIFGELPRFDHGTYTFIADYLPYVEGDGMEHRNSTILTSSSSLEDQVFDHLWTLSHEFIHCWNVERIRPASLEPFDLEAMNMSGELWFGEGFTSYYDSLVLRRLRVMALDRYLEEIANTLNYVVNSPARRLHSAIEMSQRAPLVDGAEWQDPVNRANIFVSYYSFGSAIALGLDLTLRGRFEQLALEDFMRAVWETHGRPETPYTNEDLERQLAVVTQDESFAREFFARFIAGREVVDYKALLLQAGLLLRPAGEDRAYLGEANLTFGDSMATIEQATYRGSPLYSAGLDRGDEILTIDGTQLLSDDDLEQFLDAHEPGQKLTVTYRKQGVEGTTTTTLGVDPTMELVTYERAGLEPTLEMLRFRDRWLGPLTTSDAQLSRHCPECRLAFPFEYEHCPFDAKQLRLALATDEDEK